MYRIFVKAKHELLLGVAVLICASGACIESAMAQVFRVQITGTFTSARESPPVIPPGTPFVASFLVNASAAPVVHEIINGVLVVSGYADAAISGLSMSAGGVAFTQGNILGFSFSDGSNAAVLFSRDLSNGATPSIFMLLENASAGLGFGGLECLSSCQFQHTLDFSNGSALDTGTVSVQVVGFAGMPGASNCHGKSVSALSNQYGTLQAAATTLNYLSINALQANITMFCGS
jgi:hypothetical protein